jgi:hypothetical protein
LLGIIVLGDLNLDFIRLPIDRNLELHWPLRPRTPLASVIAAFLGIVNVLS